MIILVQIIGVIFSLIMMYFAVLHYQRGEISNSEIWSWSIIWIAVLLAAVFPDLFGQFSRQVLVTRLFDLMVIGGFVLVITVSISSYLRAKKVERKFENFIRSESLKEVGIIRKTTKKSKK